VALRRTCFLPGRPPKKGLEALSKMFDARKTLLQHYSRAFEQASSRWCFHTGRNITQNRRRKLPAAERLRAIRVGVRRLVRPKGQAYLLIGPTKTLRAPNHGRPALKAKLLLECFHYLEGLLQLAINASRKRFW
jgi:hypothetical protein